MKKTLIWIGALVIGAVLGTLGVVWLDEVMNFVATVYTRLFQLLAVPTIVLAVITTFATFGSKGSGRIFGHTLTYTLLTTFAAAAVGAVLYVLVAPGNLPVETISNGTQPSDISTQTSYVDHIISVIPNNVVKPFFDGNVLSLLLLAFAIGIGLSKLPESENKAVVVKFLVGLQELLFLLIHWLIWTLPLGIVAFAAQLSAQVTAGVVADSIGKYVLVVTGGNVIQFFVVLPLFLLIRGLNPVHVLGRMMPAVLMALFTKSSAATLPVTMDTAERRLGIRKNISRFVLPICTTINMNGCAAFILVTSLFCRFGCRQCRGAHGLLFPHPLTHVGHRSPRCHIRHHPAHLHHHRHGGNGRKRMVRLLRRSPRRLRRINTISSQRVITVLASHRESNSVPMKKGATP